jgi:hypothetical protein
MPHQDISGSGLCLRVGALAVPEIFAVAFAPYGIVRRICMLVWRNGQLIGAASTACWAEFLDITAVL